jgi:hypothetical protein
MGSSDVKRVLGKNYFGGDIGSRKNLLKAGFGPYQILENVKNKPQPEQQPAIPHTDPTANAAAERDRVRRMARKATGLGSTIRANATEPYSAAPKQLLGN